MSDATRTDVLGHSVAPPDVEHAHVEDVTDPPRAQGGSTGVRKSLSRAKKMFMGGAAKTQSSRTGSLLIYVGRDALKTEHESLESMEQVTGNKGRLNTGFSRRQTWMFGFLFETARTRVRVRNSVTDGGDRSVGEAACAAGMSGSIASSSRSSTRARGAPRWPRCAATRGEMVPGRSCARSTGE
jgi:hypothetical protein